MEGLRPVSEIRRRYDSHVLSELEVSAVDDGLVELGTVLSGGRDKDGVEGRDSLCVGHSAMRHAKVCAKLGRTVADDPLGE